MRTPLSKAIRFEVFKRDRFTCQYCGSKAPEATLNVDHIEPVSKGGSGDMMNLLTSCFACNSGKRAKRLDDHSVLEKQRNQIEYMQERREQIELMYEWKKSLEKLENQTLRKVKKYINTRIKPYTISDHGMSKIKVLLNRYDYDQVLNAVDISASKYLKFSHEGEVIQSTVEECVDKIGGIVYNKNLDPVDQKIAFIKGVVKSRFGFYDSRTTSILLSSYVSALRSYCDYDDEQVLNDLERHLLLKTKDSRNWSEWRSLLEGWIENITKQEESMSSVYK